MTPDPSLRPAHDHANAELIRALRAHVAALRPDRPAASHTPPPTSSRSSEDMAA